MSDIVSAAPRQGSLRLSRISGVILLCFLVTAVAIVMAAVGTLIAPQDPSTQHLSHVLEPPSAEHWLGTDALGRDVFSRIIVGTRSALLGPLVIAFSAAVLGSLLGLVAGYYGGHTETIFMRWVDLMLALPGLLLIIVVAGAFGGGYWFAVGLLVLLSVPFDLRMARGATLEQVPRPYVEAARTLGVPDRRVLFLHIWPNISSVVVAQMFLSFAGSLIALSGLAFLGLGVSPGSSNWGLMLSEAQTSLFTNPVAVLAPAAAIVMIATCVNLIGDWSYERLSTRATTR